jgi:hypothetical protein
MLRSLFPLAWIPMSLACLRRTQRSVRRAFRFVLLLSIVSLFGDMTYEGARSVSGPFLAALGASGLVVGFVAGFGELIGFAMRYLSGSFADRSRRYWPVAIFGYALNVLCVPALALARTWPAAAALIVGERLGRGIRKPVVGAMLAHAGSELGQGWVFGFREAMDQTGATLGPLIVALILYLHGGFSLAFAVLAVPAVLMLAVLAAARRAYPAAATSYRRSTRLLALHGCGCVPGGRLRRLRARLISL